MIPGSDTAKQDLTLLVAGAIALLLFFWLYADFHPLPAADNSYGEELAEATASQLAVNFGYNPVDRQYTSFQASSVLLDTLQSKMNFKEFYANPLNRALNPAFYWKSDILLNMAEPVDVEPDLTRATSEKLEVRLSESGHFIGFYNTSEVLPDRLIHQDVLQYGLNVEEIPNILLSDASELEQYFRFSFARGVEPERDTGPMNRGELQLIGRSAAERMAHYYLIESGWPESHFNLERIEIVSIADIDAARATYKTVNPEGRVPVEVAIDILPGGSMLSMTYNYELSRRASGSVNSIVSGLRGFLILAMFFWIVILLFIRFRLRLVDLKAAILVAVIGGIIVPSLFVTNQLYSQLHSFESLTLTFFVGMLVAFGFMAAFSSIGFFAVTALSDSLTRQHWPEKLRTIDLLRSGQFVNVPLGLSIIRGICWGFILSLVTSVILIIIPGSYISIDTLFTANSVYLPYIFGILSNFIIIFLIAQVIFLILIGKLSSRTKSGWVIVSITVLIFAIAEPLVYNVGGWHVSLAVSAAAGLGLGWVYWKEDFLSLFISFFVLTGLLATASGWLIQRSPDSLEFYLFSLIVIAAFIYGGANILSRKTANDIPDFVPDYIQELASENRIKQELNIARKVQQSFLPLKTPNVPGLDVFAICKPAYETGGDYYDFIELDNDKLAIAIGDVSGKGIQAAFYMTFTKGVLYALCNDYASSVDVLSRTNKLFRKNAQKGTFISLIFGIFNEDKSVFRFSRAGHNPLLYFNHKEEKLHIYQPEGIAIGMADMDQFSRHISEQAVAMETGDSLIFYTDGIVEAVNKENELFGENRLYALIRKNHQLSSQELVEKIEEELAGFVDQTDQYDDMTIIVVKKK